MIVVITVIVSAEARGWLLFEPAAGEDYRPRSGERASERRLASLVYCTQAYMFGEHGVSKLNVKCTYSSRARVFSSVYACMATHSIDRPGKVAKPTRGELNRDKHYFRVRVRA